MLYKLRNLYVFKQASRQWLLIIVDHSYISMLVGLSSLLLYYMLIIFLATTRTSLLHETNRILPETFT